MSLFRFLWLRRLVRRSTKPIPENVAEKWKQHLSLAYMLIAWNALGGIVYLYYIGKPDLAKYYGLKTEEEIKKAPAVYFAEVLGIEKAHIVTMSGFKKVKEYEYEKKEE